jgi:hypothetical protein
MSKTQFITISRDDVEEKIWECIRNGSKNELPSNITCPVIRENFKSVWKEAKHSLPETYIYLGQYPNAFLYGLYKSENNKIYIVKSFMNNVINVVPFNKKYFE